MEPFASSNTGRYRAGGLAALYLALAYALAMPYFLAVVDYLGVADPARKVALLADHAASLQVVYLLTYVIFGVVLAALSLTLHRLLKEGAPVMMQVATTIGCIWACVLVASGLIFNSGLVAVVGLHDADPLQAALVWQGIEPVAQGLGGAGGEILGGLWVLLVSYAGLRTRRLSKPLNWLGLGIGAAGIVSVILVLRYAMYVFGLLQMVWFVWLGLAMMRDRSSQTATDTGAAGAKEAMQSAW